MKEKIDEAAVLKNEHTVLSEKLTLEQSKSQQLNLQLEEVLPELAKQTSLNNTLS